jgi:hypothetical protein
MHESTKIPGRMLDLLAQYCIVVLPNTKQGCQPLDATFVKQDCAVFAQYRVRSGWWVRIACRTVCHDVVQVVITDYVEGLRKTVKHFLTQIRNRKPENTRLGVNLHFVTSSWNLLYCETGLVVILIWWWRTERRGQVVSTPASYFGSPCFKCGLGHRLSWLRVFMVFLCSSKQCPHSTLN